MVYWVPDATPEPIGPLYWSVTAWPAGSCSPEPERLPSIPLGKAPEKLPGNSPEKLPEKILEKFAENVLEKFADLNAEVKLEDALKRGKDNGLRVLLLWTTKKSS
jgi:hypothetical protein